MQPLRDDDANASVSPPGGTALSGTTESDYDEEGNLLSCRYPGGRRVLRLYDELNRLQEIWSGGPEPLATFSYLGLNLVERRDLNSSDVQTTVGFDLLRRVDDIEHKYLPFGGTVIEHRSFAWDEVGNKTSRTDELSGVTHAYEYDDAYRLKRTTVDDGAVPTPNILRDTTYNHDGVHNRTTVAGNPDTGPHVGTYTMSAATPQPADRQMNQYTTTPGGQRTYDAKGNLIQIGASCTCRPYGDVFPPEGDGGVDVSDVLCVLDGFSDAALCSQADIAPCAGNNWAPHGDGTIDLSDLLAVSDAFGGIPQCPDTCGPTGYQCPGPVVQLSYDYHNRLVEYFARSNGQRHQYAYDAFGRRIRKIVDADGVQDGPTETRFFYGGVSQRQVIEEQDDAGNTLATYVHGTYIDHIISMDRDTNGDDVFETYFYHCDDNYNVMAVTDESGAVVESYEYGDFGDVCIYDAAGVEIPQSAIGNPYLFTSREYDAETGLYHYRTRYLDPVAGRFITRDIIGAWGDEAEFGNAYSYVGNNPWTWRDPFGLDRPDRWHHLLPQDFADDFRAWDIEPDDKEWGHIMPKDNHKGYDDLHRQWNKEWKDQIDRWKAQGCKPSRKDIEKFLKKLKKDRRFKTWLGKGKPAMMSHKKWRRLSGLGLAGTLADKLYGAAETLEDVQNSPHYESLLDAIEQGDWRRAHALRDRLEEHALQGARNESVLDVHNWLDNLIEEARAKAQNYQSVAKVS